MIGPVAVLETFSPDRQQKIREVAGEDLDLRFPIDNAPGNIDRLLETARYAVVRSVPISREQIERANGLKLIHCWGAGYDKVPVEAANDLKVLVYRSAGVNAPSVADMTLALMLAVLRRIPQTHDAMRTGKWAADDLWDTARDLGGARVGLIGFGDIAQRVARRLSGFDCDVTYWRRSGAMAGGACRYAELDDLIGQSDIVSLHIPLSDQTRGFMSRARLFAMRRGAVLINTARGEIVDEPALIEALQTGQLGGCGLDVFATEPVDPASPLLRLDSVVATPHVGGRTRENFTRIVQHWSGNIRAFAQGDPVAENDQVNGNR